jgi:hypothetical protein
MFKTKLWPYLSIYFITLVCDFEELIVTCNDLLTKMNRTPKLSGDKFSPNVETTNINDESTAIERHSHYLDHISNKEGYRAAMYWTTGDFYCGEWHKNLRDGHYPPLHQLFILCHNLHLFGYTAS